MKCIYCVQVPQKVASFFFLFHWEAALCKDFNGSKIISRKVVGKKNCGSGETFSFSFLISKKCYVIKGTTSCTKMYTKKNKRQ